MRSDEEDKIPLQAGILDGAFTLDVQADTTDRQLLFRFCLLVGTFPYIVADNFVRGSLIFNGTTGAARSCSRLRHTLFYIPVMMSKGNESHAGKMRGSLGCFHMCDLVVPRAS